MYITLWHIGITILAMEMSQYIPFIVGEDVAVNNIKVFSVAM
jgi:hypothetical protein